MLAQNEFIAEMRGGLVMRDWWYGSWLFRLSQWALSKFVPNNRRGEALRLTEAEFRQRYIDSLDREFNGWGFYWQDGWKEGGQWYKAP